MNFQAQGRVPLNFVIAATAPQLPTSLFNSLGGSDISSATQELEEFISLSGNTLTVDLKTVPLGTSNSPTSGFGITPAVAPPGSLVTRLLVQVNNITLTDGPNGSMAIDGIVMPPTSATTGTPTTGTPTTGTPTTGTPTTGGSTTSGTAVTGAPGQVPNLFGDVTGRAVTVSLGFNGPLPFPGLGILASGTGVTGLPSTLVVSMLSVQVAGNFALAAPVGFATLRVPPSAFSGVATGGTTGGGTGVTTPGTGAPGTGGVTSTPGTGGGATAPGTGMGGGTTSPVTGGGTGTGGGH